MIAPLTKPPFSPNFSGNAASNHSATNVGGTANSGGPGSGSGSGSGGGGGGGPPRAIAHSNIFTMVYPAPLISGELDQWSRPWTGGSLD